MNGFGENDIVRRLGSARLFRGLSEGDIKDTVPVMNLRIRNCGKGAELISVGHAVDDIGIVLDGRIAVSKVDYYGRLHLIYEARPYDLFAADIACTPTRISPIVIACRTEATVLTFPYALISEESRIPERIRCALLRNTLEIVANENMRQLYKIDILAQRNIRGRIVLYLTKQAKRKSNALSLPFNREELADFLCVDRSALSRELGKMQREGLIRFKKNEFSITGNLIT